MAPELQGAAGGCVQVRPFQRSIKMFPCGLPELQEPADQASAGEIKQTACGRL